MFKAGKTLPAPQLAASVLGLTSALACTEGASAQTAWIVQNRPAGEFAAWAATSGIRVITGDFDGDGRTDIGLIRQEPGWDTIPIALSGPVAFTIQNRSAGEFAAWAATPGVQIITGDFDGDGRTDIALVRQEAGWSTIPIALSNPMGFTIQNRSVGEFAAWAATSGVQVVTGDFDGSGSTDIGLVRQQAGWGTIPVALSNPLGFTVQNPPVGGFAAWAATPGVKIVAGNFNDDDRTDIALVRQEAGWSTVPVALSDLNGFTIQNRPAGAFAGWAATPGVELLVGHFYGGRPGTGRSSHIGLIRRVPGWGTLPIADSSAAGSTQFSIENLSIGEFATWATTPGVRVITGDFDGSGSTDVGLVRQEAGWGTVPVALRTLSGELFNFSIQNRPAGAFAGWAATPGVRVITGDFNGDGRTDIGLVRQESGWGTIPVALAPAGP